MRVAICDDSHFDLQNTETLINEHPFSCELQISTYNSAKQLYYSHLKLPFDLLILDIEMPEPNGFEIAEKIKSMPSSPLIIFVTKSMEYSIAGYGVAFRYIPKCKLNELLIPSIEKAISELEIHYYELETDGILSRIPTKDIIFIEIYNHNIILHTLNTEYRFRDSISNIYSHLPHNLFGLPHQSYIVNYAYVTRLTSTELCLTSGMRIPISRRRSQEFNLAFHKYLGR